MKNSLTIEKVEIKKVHAKTYDNKKTFSLKEVRILRTVNHINLVKRHFSGFFVFLGPGILGLCFSILVGHHLHQTLKTEFYFLKL